MDATNQLGLEREWIRLISSHYRITGLLIGKLQTDLIMNRKSATFRHIYPAFSNLLFLGITNLAKPMLLLVKTVTG